MWVRQRFNPRARMGRDSVGCQIGVPLTRFQSTRPHGARLTPASTGPPYHPFQSTRPHGARLTPASTGPPYHPFQSTRPHGARRHVGSEPIGVRRQFQSTRPHGARRLRKRFSEMLRMFQSTRPHGARLEFLRCPKWTPHSFNPRARMGRDLEYLQRPPR